MHAWGERGKVGGGCHLSRLDLPHRGHSQKPEDKWPWAANNQLEVRALCSVELPQHSHRGHQTPASEPLPQQDVRASKRRMGEALEKCSWFSRRLFQVFSTVAWNLWPEPSPPAFRSSALAGRSRGPSQRSCPRTGSWAAHGKPAVPAFPCRPAMLRMTLLSN